jgi:hypothetical protein
MLLAMILALSLQDAPRKLTFQVEHFTGAATPAGNKLKPDEIRAFEKELGALPGVKEVRCTESTATLTLNPDATLKLSEIRAAGKKVLTYDGGKPVIVFNTIKLQGRVTLTLHLDKNQDKVKDALKSLGFQDLTESGDDFDGRAKSAVDVVTVVKKVCQATGAEYKIFEILKDITWHPEAREK